LAQARTPRAHAASKQIPQRSSDYPDRSRHVVSDRLEPL